MTATSRALLLSQSGRCAGRHLELMPVNDDMAIESERFRALLLRRLRLQLPLTSRVCRGRSCRLDTDAYGDHSTACPRTGLLRRRAGPMERAWARVGREAGGRVRTNVSINDLNIANRYANDGRRIEVVIDGLPLYNGAQIVLDCTLVSPVGRDGLPRSGSDRHEGVIMEEAARTKRRHYRDVVAARRCRFVVAAMEVGGRWGQEAFDLIRHMAKARARSAPGWLRRTLEAAHARRWTGLIAAAAQSAYAATLGEDDEDVGLCRDAPPPTWSELLGAD